jgi:HEAT repeat protein
MTKQLSLITSALLMIGAATAFGQPDTAQTRQKRLGDIATYRSSPSQDELRTILVAGINDPEPRVRETAFYSIVGRASGRLREPSAQRAAQWKAERPVLLSLKDSVIAGLKDSDERVRGAAALALIHLGEDSDPPSPQLKLSDETIRILEDAYRAESSPLNRGELIKHIALSQASDSPTRREVLVAALSDPHDSVVGYALRGLGATRTADMLPQIAAKLGDRSRNVRLAAANALSDYGGDAKPYLPSIRDAAARETDSVVRLTLEALAKALQ